MEDEIINGEIEEVKEKSYRNYGAWKPGQRSDSGAPLKKKGRKKGFTMLESAQVDMEVGSIVNFLTFGKSKIEHPENKAKGLKPNVAMTIDQACREYGIHPNTFYLHLNKFPSMKEKYDLLKENRREYLRESAENNISRAFGGLLDISDKELIDASFRLLERTDKAYNPKTEIETKGIHINLTKSSTDLLADLQEILGNG